MDTHKEYLRLKAGLDKEYAKRLQALKDFFKVGDNSVSSPKSSMKRGDLTTLVEKALDHLHDDFNVVDVERQVLKLNPNFDRPRATISTVLKRFEGKKIAKVSDGRGPNPAVYQPLKKKADSHV